MVYCQESGSHPLFLAALSDLSFCRLGWLLSYSIDSLLHISILQFVSCSFIDVFQIFIDLAQFNTYTSHAIKSLYNLAGAVLRHISF
jgi:hypothetical protein